MQVPQVRDGQFSTELFASYQRSEQALVFTLMEMVVNGVSTRKVARITEELCRTSFAKSTVSDLCARLNLVVQAWNERELSGQRYPFVLVDALVLKVREGGRVRAVSALLATGMNATGYREILGVQVSDSETDHHGRLVNAVRVQFQGASWQRCQTHLSANIADATPKALPSGGPCAAASDLRRARRADRAYLPGGLHR